MIKSPSFYLLEVLLSGAIESTTDINCLPLRAFTNKDTDEATKTNVVGFPFEIGAGTHSGGFCAEAVPLRIEIENLGDFVGSSEGFFPFEGLGEGVVVAVGREESAVWIIRILPNLTKQKRDKRD